MKMMNDQIKELAEQAGFTVENGHIQSLAYKQTEKFAELIVQEAIEVAKNAQSLEAAAMITMHFGMRE